MVAESGDKKLSSLPFPAIVGQNELKRVLLAVATNDGLDGALIVGEKGTAKSTAVRGLVDLLPEQRAVADCPYGCAPDAPNLQCDDCRERDPEAMPVETRPVPLVTLPLGATRDRVVGTLSVEDALAGAADFDPGLLARAHRGILYVDEVNLLDDHLVDVILDAAASGVNTVERDGVSVSHPAEFTLVGTMNPEEGDLRPQLRDRFALQATVEGCREIDQRVEIIDRALETDASGAGGSDGPEPWTEYADETATLREELAAARDRLAEVTLPDDFKAEIADLCLEAGVDGHRGDVATARTAMTIAALEGRTTVIESDVHEAASYTLPHRLRSTPFEDEPDVEDLLEDRFDEESTDESESEDDADGDESADGGDGDESETESDDGETGTEPGGERSDGDGDDGESDGNDGDADSETDDSSPERRPDEGDDPTGGEPSPAEAGNGSDETGDSSESDSNDGDGSDGDGESGDEGDENAQPLVPGQQRADVAAVGEATSPDLETPDAESADAATASGSRASTAPSTDNRGARVRTEPASGDGPIDAAASVRSAATRGDSRVQKRDLRQSVRTGDTSATIVFAVDASASMRPAMRTAKGVVLDLLRDSYEHRDRVAFVAFAGEDADVLLPPTDSVSLAARHLKELPSGDRTPLPAGLETSRRVLERAETDASVVVCVTDGRANVADGSPTEATRRAARGLAAEDATVIVVDAGDDSRAGLSELVAAETGGEVVALEALSSETVRAAADHAASGGQ
ncbi:von Willebrand factor type A [Haloterrigena turkmenica DSM 5511]|uniref:von Willebrand factor type A n=1 Tax=Haloterrigena turkmenica (strain ATCC 51198 / DSM 5511 / JCM 9101 / NCIMB 13204 / VKM B-1734 / 4k) TaxID=543526 RepID=D2RYJ9_HALTV|nr:VWA domain-containing protein [Haloterrigena turkmenica]ADB59900.1 von Willebrand factor type A [Haloterrigena turkmenica DSM 5511]